MLLVHHALDAKKGCHPTAIALSPKQDPNLGIGSRRCPVGYVALKQGTAGPAISPIYLLQYVNYYYTVLELQAKTAKLIMHNSTIGMVWRKSETWQLEGYRGQLGLLGGQCSSH